MFKILLLALAYYGAGKLSLLLAIPPGFATPVWPAAGIALAAVLLWGYRCLPGVFIGSFATNLLIASQSGADITSLTPIVAGSGIAVGATLQAALGAYLVKRVGLMSTTWERPKKLLTLLLCGGAIACLINALVGPLVLLMAGIIPGSVYLVSAFTWWVGDLIGVVLFSPMLLLLASKRVSNMRKAIVTVPMLVFSMIAIFVFVDAKEDNLNDKQRIFDSTALDIATEFEKDIDVYINILGSIERFIHASDYVSNKGFEIFTQGFLNQYPSIQSLSWNRKVMDDERLTYEQEIQNQGFPGYVIKNRFDLGEIDPAPRSEVYFPVTYLAPYEKNKAAHGFDTYGQDKVTGNVRRKVLDQAKQEGRPISTGRISLVQAEGQYGLLIYHPVFRHGFRGESLVSPREYLIGYAAGVFTMPAMLSGVQEMADRVSIDIVLRDLSAAPDKQLLYDSRTPEHKEPSAAFVISDDVLRSRIVFDVAGRQWELGFIQKGEKAISDQGWELWYLLVGGLLFSAVFGVLLIVISANTETMRREVEGEEKKSRHEYESGARLNFLLVTKVLAGFASLLGLLVVLGWHSHNTALIQVHSSFAPMQYNAALGFLLSGVAIMALVWGKHKLVLLCGLLVSSIGMLTLLQYLFTLDFGIDQIFMQHYATTKTSHPGRMAPNTALNFFLFSIILIGYFFLKTSAYSAVFLRFFGSLIMILGVVALVGYIAQLEAAYGWMQLTRMAVHTAAGFILLGASIISYSWIGKTLRLKTSLAFWVSGLAGTTFILLSIAHWQQFKAQEQKIIEAIVNEEAALIQQSISDQVNNTVMALKRMAQRWEEAGGTPKQQWITDARHYTEDFTALTTIEWVDNTFHVRWVEPIEGNEMAMGLNIAFNDERRTALIGAAEKNAITLTAPIDLVQGYRAFIAYIPIYVSERFDGFIVGIYNVNNFIEKIITAEQKNLLNIQVRDQDKTVYSSGDKNIDRSKLSTQETVLLFNREWNVMVSPASKLLARQKSFFPEVVLMAGFLFSFIVGFAVYTSVVSSRRSKALKKRTQDLCENENKLRGVSEKLSLILDNAGEGIYGVNLEGCTTFANNAAVEMLGYTQEEMLNVSQHNLIHHHYANGEVYPREECNIYKALTDGEVHTEDKEVFWRKDGTALSVEYTSKPIKNDFGRITGAVVVFRDITDRKQIEQMKNEFISTVNHELRTPLTSIQGSLGLLKNKAGQFDDKSKHLIQLSYDNCVRLTYLVNDILDIEKISAGKMVFHIERVEMCGLVEDIVERHQSYAEKYDVRFDIHRKIELVYCDVDSNRFNQALVNLLSNAAKFSLSGGVVVIALEINSQNELVVSVTDNGSGIPEAFKDKIFEKFAQADNTTTRSKGGTGLGLNITKSIIEEFSGSVSFESQEGKGSTFYFILPVQQNKNKSESPRRTA